MQSAVEGIDNLNIDKFDNAHGFFSTTGGNVEDDDLQECPAGAQECKFAQRGEKGPGVRGILHPIHLYIDTCTSYARMPYRSLLENIHRPKRGLMGHSNCGLTMMMEMGELGKIQGTWVNKSGIANIVLLKLISKIWRITYDSHGGMNAGHLVIHTDQGNIVINKNEKGMPYINLNRVDGEVALYFVQTMRGNMEGFTWREVDKAHTAREVQAMVEHPTDQDFQGMVRANYILNCPIKKAAIKNMLT